MKKFWNFADGESGERTLRFEGIIGEDVWIVDEVAPKQFRDELFSGTGDICVFVDSPGGDYFCASKIYSDLREYSLKAGKVTIKIIGLAASAAIRQNWTRRKKRLNQLKLALLKSMQTEQNCRVRKSPNL